MNNEKETDGERYEEEVIKIKLVYRHLLDLIEIRKASERKLQSLVSGARLGSLSAHFNGVPGLSGNSSIYMTMCRYDVQPTFQVLKLAYSRL